MNKQLVITAYKRNRVKRRKEWLGFSWRIMIGLLLLVPMFFTFSYSLRSDVELLNKSSSLLPEVWTLEHYEWVFKYVPVFRYMLNSLICCVVVIISQMIFASMAAYAFAFFEFKGSKLIFALILMTTMIPGDVTIISNFLTISSAGLRDTYAGLVLPFLVSAMSIFMMRQFYLSLSEDFRDAATLDGCTDMGFFFRIAVPLSVPSLASLAIYEFIIIFNQYLWPLLVSKSDSMYTIQIGMSMLIGQETDEIGNVLAGAIVCMVPTCFVFAIGQKYLIAGMVSGGIKG
ncbi:MAG: carbohydrate ABC transporter permease [Christensenellaceae bacterium]|nr:carbohydrate ABC transporter permease [Christensenellaceae bacterium]